MLPTPVKSLCTLVPYGCVEICPDSGNHDKTVVFLKGWHYVAIFFLLGPHVLIAEPTLLHMALGFSFLMQCLML